MGSKHWQRKLIEAEAVVLQYNPDIFIVLESNLLEELTDQERNIPGYTILLLKTTEVQKVARLIMFVKDGINVKMKKEYMDNEVAAIWVRFGARGKKPLLISGVYREHTYLFQGPETGTDRVQLQRWCKFVESWKAASRNQDVVVLGNTNLDYSRWDNPDPALQKMVDKVKLEVKTLGYHQLVQGITRTWPGQPDSALDQVWTNNPGRIVYVQNLVRSFSDHNLIILSVRLKDRVVDRHDLKMRDMRNWDVVKYNSEIEKN